MYRVSQTWGFFTLYGLKYIVGLHCHVKGQETLPKGPVIFAVKHQSAWETAVLNYFVRSYDYCMIAKKELSYIPFFGWMMIKARVMFVKRNSKGSSIPSLIENTKKIVKDKRSIFIFPEGTRQAVDATPHYKKGIGYIYETAKIPVIPIALNSGYFWGRRTFFIKPGCIQVEFLDPIPPHLEREAFMQELESKIEKRMKLMKPDPLPLED